MARFWTLCLLMATLIIVDQLSKGAIQSTFAYGESLTVLKGFFSLTYVKNSGAAFGFMADGPQWFRQTFFLLVPVLFCGWVFVQMVKTLTGPFYMSLAYALILAGAAGNLIDRFTLGYVVDFFLFYWKNEANHFPAFNVADSCITVAAFLIIFDYILQLKNKKGSSGAAGPLSE